MFYVLSESNRSEKKVSRLLILHLYGIGNTIMFIPALRALHRKFPQAEISVIAGPGGAIQIIESFPFVTETIALDKGESWINLTKLTIKLRRKGYDTIFATAQVADWKTPLISYFSGARIRIGRANARLSFLYTHKKVIDLKKHFVEREFELLKLLQIDPKVKPPYFKIKEPEREKAEACLRHYAVDFRKPIVGLHFVLGSQFQKSWEREKIIALGNRLYRDYQANVIIFGDASQSHNLEETIKGMDFTPVNLIGKTPRIGDLAALIRCCHLFISHDSGLSHIASAVGIPVIALFGPTDPGTCRPYGERVAIIRKTISCSPCYPEKKFCNDRNCMKNIEVRDILNLVKSFLEISKEVRNL